MTSQPDVRPLPAPLQRTTTPPDQLGAELLQLISEAITNAPRSLQIKIGPSEIGHPCSRRIGYKLLGIPERPGQPPNWKATVGTAIHGWNEDVMDAANLKYAERTNSGEERFYIEERVTIGQINGEDIDGSCDLYDRVTGGVVDWKTNGPSILAKNRKNCQPGGPGPGPQYRAQAHAYGKGWAAKGLPVRFVMIIFLPRNGDLSEAVIWSEPFDPSIAQQALDRVAGIDTATKAMGPTALAILPTADAFCNLCPYFAAGSVDLTKGCPGDPASKTHFTPRSNTNEPAFGRV